jgi:hypothetical protein
LDRGLGGPQSRYGRGGIINNTYMAGVRTFKLGKKTTPFFVAFWWQIFEKWTPFLSLLLMECENMANL